MFAIVRAYLRNVGAASQSVDLPDITSTGIHELNLEFRFDIDGVWRECVIEDEDYIPLCSVSLGSTLVVQAGDVLRFRVTVDFPTIDPRRMWKRVKPIKPIKTNWVKEGF